nr:class I SAM-dependent methyltransferase [Kibdelosporangium sp. MJ126-NF4]
MTSSAAETWLRRWDAQQERYIADREERFTVLCDVVETALADIERPVVLDLGCGPGSLAGRLHERLPHATIIGIDSDPLLLGLARAHYADGITWVDADLGTRDWLAEVPGTIHAAVSTTALHWLPETKLAELYRTLGSLMAPDGVFVNGDHMGPDDGRLNDLAAVVRHRRAVRAGVVRNEEWGAWWDAVGDSPELAVLVQARTERLAHKDDHNANTLTVSGHADLLRAAGFGSVAPVWQVGDDHVLVAVRH